MPSRRTLEPPVKPKISEPESPAPTPALTKVWHSWTILVPDTPVLTQVLVTAPCVHPVVRPTLFTTSPTTALPSPVTAKLPVIVSDPLFGPLVCAIPPTVNGTPAAHAARDPWRKRPTPGFGQKP